MSRKDYTGLTYNSLTFLEFERMEYRDTYQFALWKCKCSCGEIITARATGIISNQKKSCGGEVHKKDHYKIRWDARGRKHGKYGTHPLYSRWLGMFQRCHVPTSQAFKDYGGRGIRVCPEWRDSAEPYIKYLESIGWHDGCTLTVDRIDNNGDYSPENIKLSNGFEQANNKRSNKFITYKGQTKTLAQWVRYFGVPYGRLQRRLWLGMSPEKAFADCEPCGDYDPYSKLF